MAAIARLAPAKINLFLHVGPLEADGYHPLASLVVFADVGDRLTVEPAERLSLTVKYSIRMLAAGMWAM
jgi:4-diphosphocytidyl-2-C-methyl-D-erythritol kinase